MKKNLIAISMMIMVAGQVEAGCNLPNIKGTWGISMTGQAGVLPIYAQCVMTVPSVQGNAAQAYVTGGCLDLRSGYFSSFLTGSYVAFQGKTCQLIGQLNTGVAVSAAPGAVVLGALSDALSGTVANNKKSMQGNWSSLTPVPTWWTEAGVISPGTVPFSGTFTGVKGLSLQPLQAYLANPLSFTQWPYSAAPSASNNGNGNGNGNGKGNSANAPGRNK